MKSGAVLGHELADGCVRAERPQKLDVAVADVEKRRLDSLLVDGLAVDDRHAEGSLVEANGAVEVLNGDADMVDQLEHEGEFIEEGRAG
jgi:hypothetical protein